VKIGRGEAAGRLALALFGVALGLLLAEAGLRLLAGPAARGKEQFERAHYTQYDPTLGWRNRAGATASYDRRDYRSEFRINSHGLRGPDRPYSRTPGTSRVLALGDSFVEAFMVSDGETVTAQLESALTRRGCRAEVINGGTTGYSTDQEYLFYREEGRRYAPDLVIVFVYHNDIPYLVLDDDLGMPKPRLDFSTRPPSVVGEPVPRYTPPAAAPPAPSPGRPTSYLLEFVKDHLERTSAPAYDRLAHLGLWAPLRKLPMNDELRLYHVPEMGHLRPAWSAFTWTLQSLANAVAESGGRLAIAYVPSRMEVSTQTWELTRVRYDLDGSFDRSAVASRVTYIAQRLGLPVLDLTAALTRADGMFRPTYFQTDSHWNARGQRVAGEALSAFVAERSLLPGCR
jgi:hypothetical protein